MRIFSQPERLLFAASSTVATAAAAAEQHRLLRVFKPLIGVSLAGTVARGWRRRQATDNALLLGAVAGSTCGDVILQSPKALGEDAKASGNSLNSAALAFGVAHVCYQVSAWRQGARAHPGVLAVHGAGLVGLASQAARHDPRVLPAAAGYGGLVAMTSVLGTSGLLAARNKNSRFAAGSVLFLVSDALILLRRMYLQRNLPRAIAEVGVMSTYTVAQRLLVDGLDSSQ
ncbi:lysoplasmalogenase [Corynebacterium pseudodiphtheriticum]|uniref:lysoplasmalogenase n=1 Tax=Corynebacterium pseudodiphtheriticum TaxID=37637 RepID=UPI00254F09D1|nr:lysoplasmalogenase [Corynebacterium pseudodiphtheriticum]MDK8701098.1 lysoplasmalogenase [Corynebacterium pseudodiphtheriticum]MDK8775689.1 lysoplasmalogenase [Corynebacterium pseudodiphtheriticum]